MKPSTSRPSIPPKRKNSSPPAGSWFASPSRSRRKRPSSAPPACSAWPRPWPATSTAVSATFASMRSARPTPLKAAASASVACSPWRPPANCAPRACTTPASPTISSLSRARSKRRSNPSRSTACTFSRATPLASIPPTAPPSLPARNRWACSANWLRP